jgi:hypothetical protein
MEQSDHTWSTVSIRLKDNLASVAKTSAQSVKYIGNNSLPDGVEGTSDDIGGKPKPRVVGSCEGLEPILVNTSKQIYQISVEELYSIEDVRVREYSLTAGDAYITLADLLAASTTSGEFDFYLGDDGDGAYIRLGTSPDGAVRVDAIQGATAADRTVAQVFKYLMTEPTAGNVSLSSIDTDALAALDTLNSAVVGIFIGTEERTLKDVFDELFASIGAFWTQDRSTGKFVVGLLQAPSGSPAATFYDWAFVDAETGINLIASNDESRGLPVYKVNLNYRKYFSPVTDADIAGAVGLPRRILSTNQYRTVSFSDDAILVKNLLAPEKNVVTLLVDEADANTEASRQLALFKVKRYLIEVKLPTYLTTGVDINTLVSIDVNRYTWSGGKLFKVIGMIDEYNVDRVTLILWG